MAFDLSSATPVEERGNNSVEPTGVSSSSSHAAPKTGGFDLSSAVPVEERENNPVEPMGVPPTSSHAPLDYGKEFSAPSSPAPMMTPDEQPATATIARPDPLKGSVMAGFTPPPAATTKIERMGAPITGQTRQDLEVILSQMAPEDRERAATRTDWVGSSVRALQREQRRTDRMLKSAPGSTVDFGEDRLAAERQKAFDASGSVSRSNYDFESIKGADQQRTPLGAAGDLAAGALSIGPTFAKSLANITQMMTGNAIGGESAKGMEEGMKRFDFIRSPQAIKQKRDFDLVMSDPEAGPLDVARHLLTSPELLTDMGIATVGSMGVPIGVAAVAGRAIGPVTAGRSAVVANAVMNAADTFSSINGDNIDRYTGAVVSGAVSLLGGWLTEGGVEGEIARRMFARSGASSPQDFTGKLLQRLQMAGKEGAQEIIEEIGAVAGEVTGGGAFDVNSLLKRAAVAGILGSVVGGAVGGGSGQEQQSVPPPKAPPSPPQVDPSAAQVAPPLPQAAPTDTAIPASEVLGQPEFPGAGAPPPAGGATTPPAGVAPAVAPPAPAAKAISVSVGDTVHNIESPTAIVAETDRLASNGIDLRAWLAQGDVLGREFDPETVEVLSKLDEVGRTPELMRAFYQAIGVTDEAQSEPTAAPIQGGAVGNTGPVPIGADARQATGPAGTPEGGAGQGQTVGVTDDQDATQGPRSSPDGASAGTTNRAADGAAPASGAPASDAARSGAGGDVVVRTDERGRDIHAAEVAGKPVEVHTNPSEPLKKAGTYLKGHVAWNGLNLSVENPRESVRKGTDTKGKAWESTLAHDYGYIRGTVGKDKDHVDFFMGPNHESTKVWVVDQKNPRTGLFDEHKVMLGFDTEAEAIAGYKANYPNGWKGLQAVNETTVDGLKDWFANGDTTKRLSAQKLGVSEQVEKRFRNLYAALLKVVGPARMKPLVARLDRELGIPKGGTGSAEQLRKGVAIIEDHIRKLGHGPALLRDAAMNIPAINDPAFNRAKADDSRGVNVEVAPNPDNKALTARFNALSEDSKRGVSKSVADEIVPKVLSDMGIKGAIQHTIGGFEGATQPSVIVVFDDDVPFAQMEEAAKALGYVFSQKAVISYDENDTTNGTQTGFVRVRAERPLSYEDQRAIFADVVKHFPAAGGFTGHRGAMVFGNFTQYSDTPLTNEKYHELLDAALGKVQSDLHFTTALKVSRSEYDATQSLEGTRYGKGDTSTSGRDAGQLAAGRTGNLDAIRAEAQQALARALPGPILNKGRALSKEERALTSEGVLADVKSAGLGPKPTVLEVAQYLERRARALHGGSPLAQDDAAMETIARVIAREVELAAAKDASAIGWYSTKLNNAIKVAGLLYPEINEVPEARFAFTVALAVTSNGMAISKNVDLAFNVYARYRDSGKFPTNIDNGGARSDAMNAAFAEVNKLIRDNDLDGAIHFLTTKVPARVVKEFGVSVRELMDEEVYGGTIIGSKIGGAFLQNLNGNYDALTMDRWFMRTWGRITGLLTFTGSDRAKAALADMREAMRKKGISGDPIAYAKAQYKKASDRSFERMTTMEKLARRLLAATGMRDAPENGSQRSFMRKAVARAQDLLRGKLDVTIADIQALVWYTEKDLYGAFGAADERAEPTDYEQEAIKHVVQYGIEEEVVRGLLSAERGRGRSAEDQRGATQARDESVPFNRGSLFGGRLYGGGSAPNQSGVRSDGTGLRAEVRSNAPLKNGPAGIDTPVVNLQPHQPDALKLVGVHYSDTEKLSLLNGGSYGRSTSRTAGSEWGRLQQPDVDPRIKKRVYFYHQDTGTLPPAEGVVMGNHVYRTVLTNMLDPRSDTAAQMFKEAGRGADGQLNMARFEKLVLDRGYDGYINISPGGAKSMMVVLNGNVPVEYLGTRETAQQKVNNERVVVRFRKGDTPVSERIADMDVPGGEPRKTDDEFTKFERAAWVFANLARDESFFRFPVSTGKTLDKVAKDFDPAIKVQKYPASSRDTVAVYEVQFPPSKVGDLHVPYFMVRHYKNGTIQANLASLKSGRSGGARAYQMIAEWARNAGLRFEGDVDGLEPIAHARRAEAMISSFIKSGSTKHMEPHPYMVDEGFMEDADAIDTVKGLKRWRRLDDLTKLAYTIRYAYGKIIDQAPASFGDVRYDFEKGRFYDIWSPEKDLGDDYFTNLYASTPGLKAVGGGSSSLRRAAIVNSVLRADDPAAWGRILAGLRGPADGALPGALAGLAYDRGPSAARFPVADAKRLIAGVIKRWENGPKVVLHETLASAEQALKDAGYDTTRPHNQIDDTVKGFYVDDAVHMVLPNFVSQRNVLETLAHEAVGHYGVRAIVGEKEWSRILKDITTLRATGNKPINKLWDTVLETHGELNADSMADEVIARAAEEAIDADGNVRPGFGWFKAILNKVAEWLRAHGINVKFTYAELQGLLVQSQRNIESGDGYIDQPGERFRYNRVDSKAIKIIDAIGRQAWALARESSIDKYGRAKFEALPKPEQMDLRRQWKADFEKDAPSDRAFTTAALRWMESAPGTIANDNTVRQIVAVARSLDKSGAFNRGSINSTAADIRRDADAIAAMSDDKRDNTELGDFPGHATAYNLYEARKMLPKPSEKLKRVTDNNSFALWQDYDYIANVDGEHYGISKFDDPDNEEGQDESKDKYVFAYVKLDNPHEVVSTIIGTSDVPELLQHIRNHKVAAFNRGPVWYSPLERAINALKVDKAQAKQWLSIIDGLSTKGVKKGEIEASGIKDWLELAADAPDPKYSTVTRADINSFLKQNGVQVTETLLGEHALPAGFAIEANPDGYPEDYTLTGPGGLVATGDSPVSAAIYAQDKLEILGKQWQKNGDNEKAQRFFERAEELNLWVEAYEGKGQATDTKFSSYVLPGGENYRELLLTLPTKKAPVEYQFSVEQGARRSELLAKGRLTDAEAQELGDLNRAHQLRHDEWSRPVDRDAFRSSHFDQPNILAHIRFNERTDAEGKRVLFIEEIQSDWAQKGRKEGFGGTQEPEPTRPTTLPLGWSVRETAGRSGKAQTDRIKEEHTRVVRELKERDLAGSAEKATAAFGDKWQGMREDWALVTAYLGQTGGAVDRPLSGDPVAAFDRYVAGLRKHAPDAFTGISLKSRAEWVIYSDQGGRQAAAASKDSAVERALDVVHRANIASWESRKRSAVPRAPFVGKTEAWVALALKRMIRYAADNGFDRIAWTTGEQQADRYDLSKQIRSVVWNTGYAKTPRDELKTVKVDLRDRGEWASFDVDSKGVASNGEGEFGSLDGKNIEDILGTELAAKIMGGEKGRLTGLDLKVGGDGMKAFYDKIVPNVANDLLKKMGGGRVGAISVDVRQDQIDLTGAHIIERKDGSGKVMAYQVWAKNHLGIERIYGGNFDTRPDAERFIELNLGPGNQPGFDITPAMRESATGGMPLFNRGTRNGALPRTGLLDSLVRFPGKHVARFITQPLWARVSSLAERFVPEKVKHGLVSDYGLPEPYLDAKMDRQAAMNQTLRKTHNLINQIQALDRQQARVAYIWMSETPDLAAADAILATLPAESREALTEMKQAVDDIGREAVALGMLEQEVFDRNRFAYLHRSYKKYEDAGKNQKAMRQRSIAIRGDQFKGRGLRDDITKGDLEYESTPFQRGNKYLRLEQRGPVPADAPENAKGKLLRVIYHPQGQPIPPMYESWRVDGVWEARWVNGDKVGVWRDFTRDERQMMGEIDEVRYAFGQTMMKAVRDVETARFLKWVSDEYAADTQDEVTAKGGTVVKGTDTRGSLQTFKLDEWVEVPTTKIPGTNVARYGALAGKYIPGVMFNDLRQIVNLHLDLGQTWEKILRVWKISKTGLSPAVHMNNVMSNFIMADMADVRARDIARAIKTVFMSSRDPDAKRMIERFTDSGGDLGNFAHIELGQEIEKILMKELEAELNATSDSVGQTVRMAQVLDLAFHGRFRESLAQAQMTKPVRATMWPFRLMIEAYGQEDTVFRLAKFMKELDEGATDRDAGKAARDAFLNYEINAPWIQAVRRTALPFVAFSYRAIPLLAKTAANKPWKFAKYLAVGGGLNALAYAMLGLGGDDEDKERRLLPPELSGRTLGIFPRLIRMPWNDENGSPLFLDVRRWVPAGDIFETQKNTALPLPSWLTLGGPLTMVAEIATNRASFTGKDIVKKSGTATEQMAQFLDYQFKFWAPNLPLPNPIGLAGEALIPGVPIGWLQTYSATNIMGAFKGKTDDFGRERVPGLEVLNAFGVKVRPYPPDQMRLNEERRTGREVRDIDYEMSQLRRQYQKKGLSDKEFDDAIRYQQEKKVKAINKFREKAGLATIE